MSHRPLPYRITAICLGNICRSPMAETVLRDRLAKAGVNGRIVVDSAGTGDWNLGQGMDRRARAALGAHGYPEARHISRQVGRDWLDRIDLALAMDSVNFGDLHRMIARAGSETELRMLRSFDPEMAGVPDGDPRLDVPDPYYDGPEGFDVVLDMLERAAAGVVEYATAATR